ncbi:integrase core domain-containing protein, partial [Bacteroidota bacterium]
VVVNNCVSQFFIIEQFVDYKDDVDLAEKINEWEKFYNFNRPHKSHGGLTPYEIFRAKMNIDVQG